MKDNSTSVQSMQHNFANEAISNAKILSVINTLLGFPLMIGVLLSHSRVMTVDSAFEQGFLLTGTLIDIFSSKLTRQCVPLFFFFSGYYFFAKNSNSFSLKDYAGKLKKRSRTILLPYLFWNCIVLVFFALVHLLLPGKISPDFNDVLHFSFTDFLRSFWNFPGGNPICFQFWFLRDLMVAVILSPLVYILAKYLKKVLCIILLILFLYSYKAIPHQAVVTFFTLGASCAINKYDIIPFIRRYGLAISIVFILLMGVSTIRAINYDWLGVITLTGCVCYLYIALRLCERNISIPSFLSNSGFFVYASHGILLIIITNGLEMMIGPVSDFQWTLCYVCTFLLLTVTSIALYAVFRKFAPRLTAIVTGGRV